MQSTRSKQPRKPATVDAMIDEKIDARIAAHPAFAGPCWRRCSEDGVSHKQRPSLEPHGVRFAKIGKVWCFDVTSLEAHIARQAQAVEAANDDVDFAGVDPVIAADIRRAAGER